MNFFIITLGYLISVFLLTILTFPSLVSYSYIYGNPDITFIGLFTCFLLMGLMTLKYDWGIIPHLFKESLNTNLNKIQEVKK